MGQMDMIVLIGAAASLASFFISQVIIFRFVHSEAILKWIMNIFWLSSLFHFFMFFKIGALMTGTVSLERSAGFWIMAFLSYFIFGLMAFVYILCVFGPSETSIRIRLIRELAEGQGHRLTHEELLNRYNGKMMLERRLQRFLQSGEIKMENGQYVLCKSSNAFFMIDAVSKVIQAVLRKDK